MPQGTVEQWSSDKGEGYIHPDDGGQNVWLRLGGLTDQSAGSTLTEGQRVEFEVKDTGDGTLEGWSVRTI